MTIDDLLTLAEEHHVPAAVEFWPGDEPGKGRGYVVSMYGRIVAGPKLRAADAMRQAVGELMAGRVVTHGGTD